jgi:dihydroorotate dehydrogenase electron transfer subunit
MNDLMINKPVMTARVKKNSEENYRVRTIVIEHDIPDALAGQFLMVWVPGVGERPMSIGDNNPLTISVASVGKVSSEICKLKGGEVISFRGPLGKGFTLPQKTGKPILCVGGGYGVVPMHLLAKNAKNDVIAVIGGQSKKDIIWKNQLSKVCKKVLITTDDGSAGKKGNVMMEAQELIEKKQVSAVYACGPEKMMEAVAKLCAEKNIPCQVSLERYMKCGVGVCGSCAVDGKLCCTDGPIFSGKEALSFKEFGKKHRDATGSVQD